MSNPTPDTPFPHARWRAFLLSSVAFCGTIATVALPHLDEGTPQWETNEGCSMTGSPAAIPDQKERNRLMNRYMFPGNQTLDGNADLDSLRDPKQQGKFNEEKSAEITGFVVDVKVGGAESSNCESNEPKNIDTLIYIGPEKTSPKKDCVLVYVTPRIRAQMALAGKDWSIDTLRNTMWGKKVEVTGWLYYDADHEIASTTSKNKKLHPKKPRQATPWEIHPVTDLIVFPEAPMP